jgi:gluconolactonase
MPNGNLTAVVTDMEYPNGLVFADMSSTEPDGMKVDSMGRVYCTGPGGCWVFEPDGTHLGTIRLPEIPANCAWGDPDYQTMLLLPAPRSIACA